MFTYGSCHTTTNVQRNAHSSYKHTAVWLFATTQSKGHVLSPTWKQQYCEIPVSCTIPERIPPGYMVNSQNRQSDNQSPDKCGATASQKSKTRVSLSHKDVAEVLQQGLMRVRQVHLLDSCCQATIMSSTRTLFLHVYNSVALHHNTVQYVHNVTYLEVVCEVPMSSTIPEATLPGHIKST